MKLLRGRTMDKTIIVYKSKYGAAKKYALWLEEMTGYKCIDLENIKNIKLQDYDTIILCSAIYASTIAGLSILKSQKDKQLIIFATGASPYDEDNLKTIREHNLSGDLSNIPLFYGQGQWLDSKLKFVDKTITKLIYKSLEKKEDKDLKPWMKALLSAYGKDVDWTNKSYLKPLLNYLKGEQYGC